MTELNLYTDGDINPGLHLHITIQDNNSFLVGMWDNNKNEGYDNEVLLNTESLLKLRAILNTMKLES